MKLERVVIGVDFSEPAVAAARWAARHIARGAELVLVHSIRIPELPSFLRGRYPATDALVATAREGADRRLRQLSDSLGAERIWLEIPVGRAADTIAQVARDYKADLIVVGKHGERPGIWGFVGSTAEQLVRCSHVPVLLATGMREEQPPRRLLVPVEDAAITRWTMEWARLLSTRFDAAVTVLHVVSPAVLGHVLSMAAVTSGGSETERERVEEEFRSDAQRWMRQLVDAGLRREHVSCDVSVGDAAQEIVAAAARVEADLIVMGSRGAGAIRRALIGSVTRDVLRQATCPVLAVREPEHAGREEAGPGPAGA